jgi:NADPH:quinone reductase-like Zn-dependent oxidoreductase
MLFFKNLSLLGSTMGSQGELREIVEHVSAGRLKPVVHTILPLSRIADAHRLLSDRAVFGKIVLSAE